MKLTRYIVLEHNNRSEISTYMGGRYEFAPYNIPNNLGKLFDRKGLALKKAKVFTEEERKYGSSVYYSVSRVTFEIEDNIESNEN